LYKSSTAVLINSQQDLQVLKSFSEKTKYAINSGKHYKEQLKQARDEHHRNILNIADNYIKQLSKKYSVEFIFTSDSLEAMKNFNSNILRLQSIIENAAAYAYNLNSHDKSKSIAIEEEYLELENSDILPETQISKDENPQKNVSKKERAELMLNRLEQAVKKVLANKEKTNGINVGKAFTPPISAAAITDFLKKRTKEINEILTEHPSRFPESRQCFKPLQNVASYSGKALMAVKSA
jgi:hypothetical protein